MASLKPCPFCGGEARLYRLEMEYTYYNIVACPDCRVWTRWFASKNDAISAWNTRAEKEPAPLTGGYGHDQY